MGLKYSVIIPVYNAEQTLPRCLDSLLGRDRQDREIVLVNDGSGDSSEEIIREYMEKNSSIRYIYQENKGVSAARNKGLSAAEGEYITFVDSDDWVSSDYFEQMDAALKEGDWDWVIFSSTFVEGNDRSERTFEPFSSSERSSVMEKVSELICHNRINAPWSKVYKKDLIRQNAVTFTEGSSMAEDRAFNIKYAACISSLMVKSSSIYRYCISGSTSLTRGTKKDFLRDIELADAGIRSFLEGLNIMEKDRDVLLRAVNFGVCRTVYTQAKQMLNTDVKYRDRIKAIHKMCREIRSRHLCFPKGMKWSVYTLPVKMDLAVLVDAIVRIRH